MNFADWLADGAGFLLLVFVVGFLVGCYVTEREQERWNRKR